MASTISIIQARAMFTSMCVDVYTDMLPAFGFLRSFFPSVQEFTRYVSIQVERDLELVAPDVFRHSEGTVNKFAKQTDKEIDPPYYHEIMYLTDIDLYDRAFGSTAIDAGVFTQFVATVARRLTMIRAKIERAIEIQAAGVLETGVITLLSGDSINYRRKAASLVANSAGNTFATNTVDPFAVLGAGCDFVRQVGKSGDVVFNGLFGATALANMMNNTIFKERVTQNLNNSIDSLQMPDAVRNSLGYAYHGQLTVGSYRLNLLTYPQTYDTVSGSTVTANPYLNNKKVVILPLKPRFKTAFAAVPQVPGINNNGTIETPSTSPQNYLVENYIDQKKSTHEMSIKSAPVVIPTAVDQIYTVQVVA